MWTENYASFAGFPSPKVHNMQKDSTAVRPIPFVSGLGTAFPPNRYTQDQIKNLLGIKNKTVHKLLDAGHICTRYLYLPKAPSERGAITEETQEALNAKFNLGVREIGARAVRAAIQDRFDISEIDFLVCVTSSGFSVPGVSSIIARELNFPQSLYRLDVVGDGM